MTFGVIEMTVRIIVILFANQYFLITIFNHHNLRLFLSTSLKMEPLLSQEMYTYIIIFALTTFYHSNPTDGHLNNPQGQQYSVRSRSISYIKIVVTVRNAVNPAGHHNELDTNVS